LKVALGSRRSLTFRIVFGMVVGMLLGLALSWAGTDGPIGTYVVGGVFYVGGKIFLASLRLVVVPLVLVSLICGTAALDDIAKLGRVGGKTIGLYLMTTGVAVTLALTAALLFQPGAGFALDTDVDFTPSAVPSFVDTLVNLFPTNPVHAMAEGNMLQIIVFAGLFGLALTMAGEAGRRVLGLFNDLNEIIMRLVMMLMQFAPYGVFCLIAKVFATQGLEAIAPLAKYFTVVLGVLLLHALLTYPTMLRVLARLDPRIDPRDRRAPSGCRQFDRLLHDSARRHDQHGWHRDHAGRGDRLHRAGLRHRYRSAGLPDGGPHRDARLDRHRRSSGGRPHHAGDGTAPGEPARRGHRPGDRRGSSARHGANRRQRDRRRDGDVHRGKE
jgi:hypothetical protein